MLHYVVLDHFTFQAVEKNKVKFSSGLDILQAKKLKIRKSEKTYFQKKSIPLLLKSSCQAEGKAVLNQH